MPATARLGDECTGHGSYPPRPNIEGSGDVYVNGIPIHRVGDGWAVHCNGSCHDGILAEGSATVFANGRAVGRIGDPVSCGSDVAEGSSNVFTGDSSSSIQIEGGVFVYSDAFAYSLRAARHVVTEAGTNAVLDEPVEEHLKANLEPGFPEEEPVTEPTEDVEVEDQETPIIEDGCPVVDDPSNPYGIALGGGRLTVRSLTLDPVFPHPIRAQRGLSVEELICNAHHLTLNVIDPILARFPELNINSAFRRGESGSQHNLFSAVDFQRPGGNSSYYREVLEFIAENIPYDQCIIETSGNRNSDGSLSWWIHVSYDRNKPQQRKQRLTYMAGRSPAYTPGWEMT